MTGQPLSFDEQTLISELELLPVPLRAVFAAACAERQIPAFRLFDAGRGGASASSMELALQEVWTHLDAPKDATALEPQVDRLMNDIPQESTLQERWTQEATNAQNAGMAVVYALRTTLRGDSQEAAWAARVAYEAIDNFVINTEAIANNDKGAELRVRTHPLVQAELVRQRIDLDELKTHSKETVAILAARVRTRARGDSNRFFG